MREVPRAVEPDEELLEDHDIVEVQEPPQMMILHKRNPESLFKMERSTVFPKELQDR
jgi:hypothetical protein